LFDIDWPVLKILHPIPILHHNLSHGNVSTLEYPIVVGPV
jgi:hypothetical protein